MIFETRLNVSEADLDPEYRHVHHAQIIRYLEQARAIWIAGVGHSWESLKQRDLFPVISKIEVAYLREIKGGEILIKSGKIDFTDKIFKIEQEILNSRGKLAVTAIVEIAFFSQKIGRGVGVPQDLKAKLSRS